MLSDDDEEESDEETDEEEEFDFELEGDFDIVEDDFAEESTLDRMIGAWKTTPPLTKAYLSASFAATMMGYLTNKNQFPKILTLEWKPTFDKLAIMETTDCLFKLWSLWTGLCHDGTLCMDVHVHSGTSQSSSSLRLLDHDFVWMHQHGGRLWILSTGTKVSWTQSQHLFGVCMESIP